jgi:NAD(P)-dependent dehydrogenase (short-subunit alcohol dehydrogenase family)
MRDLFAADREPEVGYVDGQRHAIRLERAPLSGGPASVSIDDSSVILLTGGARGITAQVARSLALRYRPTLLLVGRSPWPAAPEDPATAHLQTAQELKATLAARLRGESPVLAPVHLDRECRRILHEREMRATWSAIESAGARVRYYQVDVQDAHAVRELLDGVYREYGRLDGVIHGAGIIDDKSVAEKQLDSFQRVFRTKSDSGFLLARLLRFETLQFLVFFSSVSARFGNRGQADYAAANEVLNKLACQLDAQHGSRVVAIDWGPWAKAGMVSPELERQFIERGVPLIQPEVGLRMLEEELRLGSKGEAEVVVAGRGGNPYPLWSS